MSTFYVILETVKRGLDHKQKPILVISDRHHEAIEAKDLDDAWDKARQKWYDDITTTTQIVNIVTEEPQPVEPEDGEDTDTEQHAGDEDGASEEGDASKVSGSTTR